MVIRVGILHSLTGTMALSEAPVVDAVLMAIAEINQSGGVLGQWVEPVIEDGASKPEQFRQKARYLVEQAGIKTVFGCWTSLCRKAVQPIFEAQNALLWYPVQYEGLEQSQHIFYTGSCPNQQVEPALEWLLEQHKRRFYLIGADYVFPRTANKIIRGYLRVRGGKIVGEQYLPLDETDFTAVIADIQATAPDVVFNTLNGEINLAFYQQYRDAGITAAQLPIMAVSVAEPELQRMKDVAVGHYACWSYFQSLETPSNLRFVQNFQQRYGADRVTSDPIVAAYTQVYLWRQAVEAAQSLATDRIRLAAYGQSFAAPGGGVRIESNHHLWKACRIGQVLPTGQFAIISSTQSLIKPLPWLGVEEVSLNNAATVMDLLGEVPQGIQYSWELEQQSRVLETALMQLREEIAQRQKAEAALKAANAEITALNRQLQAENLRMSTELEVTQRLQQMILPWETELQQVQGLDIAGFMQPAAEVGGDYYDVLQHNGKVNIAIGDVTGHGLESGMVMLMAQTAVRTLLANGETNFVRLLNAVNRSIYDNTRRMKSLRNMTLTLLDYESGLLRLMGQHEEVIVVRHSGEIEQIDTLDLGFPLGIEADITPFLAEARVNLYPGDLAVLYTDGITEAIDSQNQQYGLQRLKQVVQCNRHRSALNLRQAVIDDVMKHIGSQKVFDDITLVILKQN